MISASGAGQGPGEDELAQLEERESARRGAWYADPFGGTGERWWDGTKWTREVRGPSSGAGALDIGPRPPHPGPGPPGAGNAASASATPEFPARLEAAAGAELRVAQSDPTTSLEYELRGPGGRIGLVILSFGKVVARMACAEDAWDLSKRRPHGWELLISSPDGRPVGWYSGRHRPPGGTISSIDGAEADLRRSLNRQWRLQSADGKERFADIRISGAPPAQEIALALRSLPPDAHMVLLTACAVMLLYRIQPWSPG